MNNKEVRFCKNKECNKTLPERYKYKYCEACRNKHAGKLKGVVKGVGGSFLGLGLIVLTGFRRKS